MLTAEQAEVILKQHQTKEPLSQLTERLAQMPQNLQTIAQGLRRRNAENKDYKHDQWQEAQEKYRAAMQAVNALPAGERKVLFTAFFPKVAEEFEAAWQLMDRIPYQQSSYRVAFRAPKSAGIVHSRRENLLNMAIHSLPTYADADVVWLAEYAGYFGYHVPWCGYLFAAAIDKGDTVGDKVYNILIDSANGTHEVAATGRHVFTGLLCASRPEGWEFVEKYLLAAQRNEGLRQVVLESIDEAHPEAFRRMIRLILEHDLARFSATVRAVDVWFGFNYEAGQTKPLYKTLSSVLGYMEEPETRSDALNGSDGEQAYLALWATAFEDVTQAIPLALPLLDSPETAIRFAAAFFLTKTGLEAARKPMLALLDDPDVRIAALASPFASYKSDTAVSDSDKAEFDATVFEILERNVSRFPKQTQSLKSPIWDWLEIAAGRDSLTGMLPSVLGNRPITRLKSYVAEMEPWTRRTVCNLLAERGAKNWNAEEREMLFGFLKDASPDVREQAFTAMAKADLANTDMETLEALLTRKSSDVRQGVIKMLLRQKDKDAVSSVGRLVEKKDAQQRSAGLEMARQMVNKKRSVETVRQTVVAYNDKTAKKSELEEKLTGEILNLEREEVSLKDALGLMADKERSPVVYPVAVPNIQLDSKHYEAIYKSLDKLIASHKQTEVDIKLWNGDVERKLFGDISDWAIPMAPNEINADTRKSLPLYEVWEEWARTITQTMAGVDRTELLRACVKYSREANTKRGRILTWVLRMVVSAEDVDFLLDAAQTELATLPYDVISRKNRKHWDGDSWRATRTKWLQIAQGHRTWFPEAWTVAHHARMWQLIRWMQSPFAAEPPAPPAKSKLQEAAGKMLDEVKSVAHNLSQALGILAQSVPAETVAAIETELTTNKADDAEDAEKDLPLNKKLSLTWVAPALEVAYAFAHGAATEGDVIWMVLGERDTTYYGRMTSDLGMLMTKQGEAIYKIAPVMREIVMQCRDRVVEIELKRGDLPTPASPFALMVGNAGGADVLLAAVKGLGKNPFTRSGWYWYSYREDVTRGTALSHFVRASKPLPEETPEAVAAKLREAGLSDQRLVEIAVFAPQWARHVEAALNWNLIYEAIWWLNAHTKDGQWEANAEVKEMWGAEAENYTPLTGQNLLDGAVDVGWFHRIYEGLGAERWTVLDNAAKYASGGGGHKRAQLFADAMLGRVEKDDILSRIEHKRNQDAVRALGLLPLQVRDKDETLRRYKTMQEFVRTSKQFGPQRQASEKLAATIGMENLARTAGYPDPLRLEWAMEREAVADLALGAVSVTKDETTITLSINALGMPEISTQKAGKPLKAVPQTLKKDAEVVALTGRKTEIERQARRMRESLEQAMIRGDKFRADELQVLLTHPVLAPMLRNLVFVGANGLAGYPADGGKSLEACDSAIQSLADDTALAIAHPYDLLQTGKWSEWQRNCFLRERVQPFKQVFRELYVPTPNETEDGTLSRRYAGHQINPRQGFAIMGKRGWVNAPEEGLRRTFHSEGLAVYVEFNEYFTTPAEVEGLTVENVRFTKRNEWKPLRLEEIPPRIFSEAMRDVDLMVSVAHQGGIDPEASASTIEMREAILRETCRLLKIENIRYEGKHALIDGQLANYSVHLGSATVHQQPGGYLCIVPVHGQHRGRLFLPFADDDPRTAECVSKVLLLAKDKEIKDLTVLEQILRKH